jgi:hypothetical protein
MSDNHDGMIKYQPRSAKTHHFSNFCLIRFIIAVTWAVIAKTLAFAIAAMIQAVQGIA